MLPGRRARRKLDIVRAFHNGRQMGRRERNKQMAQVDVLIFFGGYLGGVTTWWLLKLVGLVQ